MVTLGVGSDPAGTGQQARLADRRRGRLAGRRDGAAAGPLRVRPVGPHRRLAIRLTVLLRAVLRARGGSWIRPWVPRSRRSATTACARWPSASRSARGWRSSYTLAAALAGAAGALLAQTTGFASLDVFDFHRSADVMLMLVVGGTGWLYGGVAGAIVFKLMQDALSAITPQYWTFWLGPVPGGAGAGRPRAAAAALDLVRRRRGGMKRTRRRSRQRAAQRTSVW